MPAHPRSSETPMPKTKFIRVAKSGKTIDGREITPAQVDQMAASYNPATYGARVWIEHLRSMLPDSPFKAYGDVLALKSETDADGGRVLLAQVDAIPDLVKMAADRQKVFWSIEMDPNFAGSSEAYMVGLAVTDSPASLGTEMLAFAVTAKAAPEAVKAHLFSVSVEAALEAEEPPNPGASLLSKVKDLLAGKGKSDDARFAQVDSAVTAIAEVVAGIRDSVPKPDAFADAGALKALSGKVETLSAQLAELTAKLSNTPGSPPRPKVAGPDANQTDC